MKRTIKEDQERLVLYRELLNDNSLLEFVAGEGQMNVVVRYIDSPTSGMKEHTLIHMNIVDFMKHQNNLLRINEDKTAIATYLPTEDGYVLRDVYDTVEHEFGIPEFVDLEYGKRFATGKEQPLVYAKVKK